MKQKHTTIQTEKRRLIKYIVQEDCTLDYTNFEAGEEIEIPDGDYCPNDWKGIEWFAQYPQIFEPVYEPLLPFGDSPTPIEVKEGQHTPGPWVISPASTQSATWDEIYSADMEKLICSIDMNKQKTIRMTEEGGNVLEDTDEIDEAIANAELIASAPQLKADNIKLQEQNRELLEALKSVIAQINAPSSWPDDILKNARELISKHNK